MDGGVPIGNSDASWASIHNSHRKVDRSFEGLHRCQLLSIQVKSTKRVLSIKRL
jgi:hypothetical protein